MLKEKAKTFATKAHQGQTRKNSDEAYITHPIRVAQRLELEGCSDALVCAAYLHDVVEDTPVTIDDIQYEFGKEIALLVAAHTEDKSKSWKERKQHTIKSIQNAPKEVKYLIIADKLDNLIELEKEYALLGDSIWANFNAGYDQQKWYNQSIVKYMYCGLNQSEIPVYFTEYAKAVERVFSQK
ncbi:HD domain-containing protein [Oceanobacillus iheyensis]|uniref:HD domain-containing protein n=1 Tax=Oceanobacillus iheyensis TaxID=182710 RepID=UPI003642E680